MKTFKEFMIAEDIPASTGIDKNTVSIDNENVRDHINSALSRITNDSFLTPYIALERVSQVLAHYHIHLPRYIFTEGDSDSTVFEINQYGEMSGIDSEGNIIDPEDSGFYLYFEFVTNENGMIEVFSEIVDEDDLDELTSEETDEEEEEELDESKQADIIHHSSYSGAIQHAVKKARDRGYEVDTDEYERKVALGSKKPSEGKTVSHSLKLHKDGKESRQGLHIQVYNKGGDKAPYELNHYISESKYDLEPHEKSDSKAFNDAQVSMKKRFSKPALRIMDKLQNMSMKKTVGDAKGKDTSDIKKKAVRIAHHMSKLEKSPDKDFASIGKTNKAKALRLTKEESLDESKLDPKEVDILMRDHRRAAEHHKSVGNIKGYNAHADHYNDIADASLKAGPDAPIPATKLLSKSNKIFSNHPIKVLTKEESLDEISKTKLDSYREKAKSSVETTNDLHTMKKRSTGARLANAKIAGKQLDENPLLSLAVKTASTVAASKAINKILPGNDSQQSASVTKISKDDAASPVFGKTTEYPVNEPKKAFSESSKTTKALVKQFLTKKEKPSSTDVKKARATLKTKKTGFDFRSFKLAAEETEK